MSRASLPIGAGLDRDPSAAGVLEALAELRADVRRVLEVVSRLERRGQSRGTPAPDDLHAALLGAIADALGVDPDLPFLASELLQLRYTSRGLDEALEALTVNGTGRLGALLRSIAKRGDFGSGLCVRRSGDGWVLCRT